MCLRPDVSAFGGGPFRPRSGSVRGPSTVYIRGPRIQPLGASLVRFRAIRLERRYRGAAADKSYAAISIQDRCRRPGAAERGSEAVPRRFSAVRPSGAPEFDGFVPGRTGISVATAGIRRFQPGKHRNGFSPLGRPKTHGSRLESAGERSFDCEQVANAVTGEV